MNKRRLSKLPKGTKYILTVSIAFYLWFLASTLILPLKGFIGLPDALFLTIYKLIDFPLAILAFILCVSAISSILIISEFKEKKVLSQMFLIEGYSFILYFIIPLIATVLLLFFVFFQLSGYIPTPTRLSMFLEDLFLFMSTLFLLTAILNVATRKLLYLGKCCNTK
jgi:hypothetical protein